jgi:hypothetical protein
LTSKTGKPRRVESASADDRTKLPIRSIKFEPQKNPASLQGFVWYGSETGSNNPL